MKYDKRVYFSIIYFIIGVVLLVLSIIGKVDMFFNCMGIALIVIGAIQMFRHHKYNTDENYREDKDIQFSDERFKYISNKSWAWAGYLYVLIAAVGTIIFQVLGYEQLAYFSSFSLLCIVVIRTAAYMIIKNKY